MPQCIKHGKGGLPIVLVRNKKAPRPVPDVLDGRDVEDDHEQGQHQADDEGGVVSIV